MFIDGELGSIKRCLNGAFSRGSSVVITNGSCERWFGVAKFCCWFRTFCSIDIGCLGGKNQLAECLEAGIRPASFAPTDTNRATTSWALMRDIFHRFDNTFQVGNATCRSLKKNPKLWFSEPIWCRWEVITSAPLPSFHSANTLSRIILMTSGQRPYSQENSFLSNRRLNTIHVATFHNVRCKQE